MMRKFNFMCVICLLITQCLMIKGNSIEIVRSISKEIKNPSKIIVCLCWNNFEMQNLLSKLSADGLLFSKQNANELIPPRSFSDDNLLIIVDWNCDEIKQFMNEKEINVFNPNKWIVIDTEPNITFLDVIQTHNIGVSNEIFHIRPKKSGCFDITNVYKISYESPVISEPYGTWCSQTFTQLNQIKIVSRRRQNLKKSLIKAAMVITHSNTKNHLDDYHDQHIDTITKVNYILTNHLITYLNASIRYTIVNTWGYFNVNTSTWNGMIGELVSNQADLGATALFFTSVRIPVIQYVAMTTKTRSKIVFQSPKLSYTDNVFLLPFTKIVWICVIALIPIIGAALALVTYTEWKVPLKPHDGDDTFMLHPSFKDALQLVFCAVCQQGSSTTPRTISARMIMFFSFLILMFLYASYSANIVALLGAPSSKIKTLEDFLNSRLKLGADDTVFNRFYFPRQTEPIRKAIYNKKIVNRNGSENFFPLDVGVARIRDGLFGFHFETGPGYKLISETFNEDEKCGLQELSYLEMIDPYYAIQKNSTFKENVKIGLFRMYEHGIQDRENTRYYPKKPKCAGTGGKFISVSLIDVEPAILLLCWGYAIAFTTFLIEKLVQKLKVQLKHYFINHE